ncbi:uncharacterized protein C8Q71DRAFT_511747 [Rhodofomes roseus]|uniref:Uncharacterized protein n=1 Tax=Rhodofomes roseus TaxID=34475 RepID=A0ABQ8KMJ3_9APHY|nr:uncharacterized protein C8Q71DRAFT_511747 [Rhodofomes roseus]KAH9839431.1 hypothetical protein C8Q71DRAFT_511747 [Rhodofomes roseus]
MPSSHLSLLRWQRRPLRAPSPTDSARQVRRIMIGMNRTYTIGNSPSLSTGCNTVVVACYAAAGFTFGTVIAAPAVPAVILGCNAALGTCAATCATVALFAPTP